MGDLSYNLNRMINEEADYYTEDGSS